MRHDDNAADKDKTLDAAERKLSGLKGRTPDVDKLVAQNRAKEERDRAMQKKAEEKLEATHTAARERVNELRTEKLESENKLLEEKQQRLEEAKRLDAKRRSKADQPRKDSGEVSR